MKKKNILIILGVILLILILIIMFKKPSKEKPKGQNNNPLNNLNIKIIERKEEAKISVNDLIKIGDTEEFYVINTDKDKTTLIGKYNLYVGANYKYDEKNDKYILDKTISSDEKGYGLQNEKAVGNISKDKETIGGVYFSSSNYWVDSNNKLISKYGTYENKDTNWVINKIYDNNYKGTDYTNYSIAYFIELYINKLKELGVKEVEGRILTYEELDNLGCHLVNLVVECNNAPEYLKNSSFYLGTAYNDTFVYTNKYEILPYNGNNRSMFYKGSYLSFNEELPVYSLAGVRPVIKINTSDIK